MENRYITDNQRHVSDFIEKIKRYLDYDSYYLTRDDRDSIQHRLDELYEFVSDTYRRRAANGN